MNNIVPKIFLILTTIFIILSDASYLHAVYPPEWYDLEEGEHKIFGSEKEEKYPVNNLFIQKEDWGGHSSCMFLGFYKTVDYPKYSSTRFLPVYYKLESKIDNRSILITPLYYSFLNKSETNKSFLYMFWWGSDRSYNSYQLFLPFLSYHKNETSLDGLMNTDICINPVFIKHSISGTSAAKDNHYYETTWWFPVIPLTYNNISPEGVHRNILWLIDYSWNRKENKYERVWFAPFFFLGNNYKHILPPVFISTANESGESYMHLLPFFIKNKSITADNGTDASGSIRYYTKTLISPVYSYNRCYYTDTEEPARETLWFPLIPVIYLYDIDLDKRTHRNLLVLFDWVRKQNETERLWILPVWFWKKDSYNHILPPLWISFGHETGESYFHLLPLYFHRRSIIRDYDYSAMNYRTYYSDSTASPLFCDLKYYNNSWQGEPEEETFWAPIIPLYFMNTDPKGVHKNYCWLFDTYTGSDGHSEHLWVVPFWFSGNKDNQSYRHIIPPLFISFKTENGYYRHFLPLYFNWRNDDYNESGNPGGYTETTLSLYSCREKYTRDGIAVKSSFWFPLLPLVYHSSEGDRSHTNILGLVDYKDGESFEHFWLMPFVFHKPGSGYRIYLPFYMRPSGNTEENGYSFGILHYHSWSPESRIMWLGPCVNYFRPLKEERLQILFPVYLSWKFKSRATVLLPWSVSYEDKKRSFYVNLLGLSRSVMAGPLSTDISVGAGEYKERWYLDTELSWLYNAFSLSTRVSMEKPFRDDEDILISDVENSEEAKAAAQDPAKQKPLLRHKGNVSRENSEFFWGWKFLFGWTAYESADTRRHFRLLPLSWFTWDTESSSKLYTVPFAFLSYESEEDQTEYLAIFPAFIPLYGHQKEKESYKYAYLLNALWIEFNDEDKLHEYTALWPFINFYYSPVKSGFRVFPVVWHKQYQLDENNVTRTIVLPVYYSKHERDKNNNIINKFVINPLYYSTMSTSGTDTTSKILVPLLLYYTSAGTMLNPPEWQSNQILSDEDKIISRGKKIENIADDYSFAPFYYSHTRTIKTADSTAARETLFLLGYYSYASAMINETIFLFGLYGHSRSADTEKYIALYGLFNRKVKEGESEVSLMPFYYSYKSDAFTETSALLGLFRQSESSSGERDFRLLYGLLYGSSAYKNSVYTDFDSGNRTLTSDTMERWWILPFPSYYEKSRNAEVNYTRKSSMCLFWYSKNESDLNNYASVLWIPVLPLFYKYESDTQRHWNFMLLFDSKSAKDYERFMIFPFLYKSETADQTHYNIAGIFDREYDRRGIISRSMILPLYMWFSSENNFWHSNNTFVLPPVIYYGYSLNERTLFLAGLYLYRSDTYERQNFFYLLDHRNYIQDNRNYYGCLFNSFSFESSDSTFQCEALYGLLAGYNGFRHAPVYEFDFLKFIVDVRREVHSFSSDVFLVSYYRSSPDSWSWLSPVALTYLSEDTNGDFDLGLLGLLYYRNNKVNENYETKRVLLGSVYNEIRRPERGYHSTGSLWGFLWEYETESETNFKKFSILKGLYKYVNINGTEKQQFLWFL